MSFLIFLSKRFFRLLILLFILSILAFAFSRWLPGDVTKIYIGNRVWPGSIKSTRIELGLDKPLPVQYLIYMKKLVKGDMGVSLRTRRPVFQNLIKKIPITLELVLLAMLLAFATGIPLGVLTTIKYGTSFDEAVKWLSSAMISSPIFFLALLLQIIFFDHLGWFPFQGKFSIFMQFENPIKLVTGLSLIDTLISGNYMAFKNLIWHLVLPVIALTLYPLGLIIRLIRSSLIEVMRQDYILSARASGMSEWRLYFQYGLRNAISSVLSMMGIALALTFLNAIFVEQIFDWPGIGHYALRGIIRYDYSIIIGVTMMIGAMYLMTHTLTDILRKLVDPRIK